MTVVPVFDATGKAVDSLEFDVSLTHVVGRTSKSENGQFYKGVGAFYKGHASLKDTSQAKPSHIFYYGNNCFNSNWEGKFGIFQQRYQPFFSDFIGACGQKELKIIENSSSFKQSAVSVDDCVEWDSINKQMFFILNYVSERQNFLNGGDVRLLVTLIHEMLNDDWNFPWDKASIRDINTKGFVTDVADMFKSSDIKHKFGTVYSILYSLHTLSISLYTELLTYLGLKYVGQMDIPFVCLFLLGMNKTIVEPKTIFKSRQDFYIHLIANVLLRGRNCASVENVSDGDSVMLGYIDRFRLQVPSEKRGLIEVI